MSDVNTYIEYEIGNIPLIISVSHGGTLDCDSIPQRSTGIFGIDKGTIELSKELCECIRIKFKNEGLGFNTPSYIVSKIRRNKIDLNRKKDEAYNRDSFFGREIYEFYHNKIKSWIFENLNVYNRSLLIDIHGFERKARPQGFRDVDMILGTDNLKSFFSMTIPKRDWGKNLRGNIIRKFLQSNIPIAPGHPRRREYVLSGGYITTQYGASNISRSQAIQIEFSEKIRIYDIELKKRVLSILTDAIFEELAKA
ncbi:MAG: hypothetical protein ACFE91_09685 [Promethearchaeota archaeon]